MTKSTFPRYFLLFAGLAALLPSLRYVLPVLFPFLAGTAAALAAEPGARLLKSKFHLKPWAASGICVTGVLVGSFTLLVLLLALLVREAGQLTAILPGVVDSVEQGMGSLEGWLLTLASSAPHGVRGVLTQGVTGFFSDSSAVMERLTQTVLRVATGLLSGLTKGALSAGTGILSAYMISARLEQIRAFLGSRLPAVVRERYVPALKGVRHALTGWLTAQFKLMLITAALLCAGFLLLKIPHAPVWAAVIAIVDALPVLGSGVALVPWSLVCLLRGQRLQGLGLLGLYALVWLTRSTLEPKLLGKELGLDPLVTLIAIYAGYKLLGLPGMLLAPLAAVTITRLSQSLSTKKP